MKQRITITSLILSGILIIDSMNVADALVMFIIAGQIPGTPYYLSAESMMAFFMMIIGFIASRLTLRALAFFVQPKLHTQDA